MKPFHYERAIVINLIFNNLNEVTEVSLRKAGGEVIRRHVSQLVLLLPSSSEELSQQNSKRLDNGKCRAIDRSCIGGRSGGLRKAKLSALERLRTSSR